MLTLASSLTQSFAPLACQNKAHHPHSPPLLCSPSFNYEQNNHPELIDLLVQMMKKDPGQRVTCEALWVCISRVTPPLECGDTSTYECT